MIKTKIQCSLQFVEANGVYNNEIFYYNGGGWDSRLLATCIDCGELFLYDEQELFFKKLTLKQRAKGLICPECDKLLEQTLEKYPETFRTKTGFIGHFTKPNCNVDDSVNIEIWDLFS